MAAMEMPWDYKTVMDGDPAYKQSDIEELRIWVQGLDAGSVIPKDVSDKMLLCFHVACQLKMADTKTCIKTYYSVRDKDPEHFDDRDMNQPVMQDIAKTVEFSLFPERSDDGYLIIYHRLQNSSPDKYIFNASCKMLMMTMDRVIIEHGPSKGILLLFDMKGVKLGHLTRVNIGSLAKFFTYIQEGMPMRIQKILIMNTVPFFDKVMMLMKPFMKKELIALLNLFPPDVDLDNFHRTILPKRCLPPDYGGDLPDIQTLHKKNIEKLTALKPYFDAEEKNRHMFSKKSKKKSKIEKGFQDLNID